MTSVARSAELERLVAGGFSDVDGDRDAAVWTAKTGPFLHRVTGQSAFGGPGDQQINFITVGGPGFIAVGEETLDDDTNAVVWTSTDGREWTRVDDPSASFGGEGEQRMFAVGSSSVGIVAAGSDILEPDRWDAAVWTSVDGLHWDRLPGDDPSMTTLTDIGDQEIKALVATDDGFLALGAEKAAEDWDARVWIGERIP